MDLSVVIVSCRPQWLANCLQQFYAQSLGGLQVEPIVVIEGNEKNFVPILNHFKTPAIFKSIEGLWGAFAKDVGISKSNGEYICFWDDDNIYYPHALTTLYATAEGSDLGIVSTGHMATWFKPIPKRPILEFGNVDTMCICVKNKIARMEKWANHKEKGTDYAYIKKLIDRGIDVRWSKIRIGEKLLKDMENL